MSHSEVKKILFDKNPNLKKEYDALSPRYEIIKKAIDARIKANMSQKAVAEKMGTTVSSISRFESGNYNPSFDFIIRFFNSLNKKVKINII